MDKLTVRKPTVDDLGGALRDLVTLTAAPPLVLSGALLVLLTGNLLLSFVAVVLVSFVHAFWSRLIHDIHGDA